MPQPLLPFDGALLDYSAFQLVLDEQFTYRTREDLEVNWSMVPMNGGRWVPDWGWEHERFENSRVTPAGSQGGVRLTAVRQDGLPNLGGRTIKSRGAVLVNRLGPDRLSWPAPTDPHSLIQGYRYGLFELRAKLPANSLGSSAQFWLFAPNIEIDMLDNLTDNTARILQNSVICWHNRPTNHQWNDWELLPGSVSGWPPFSPDVTYQPNDRVRCDGRLYRATAVIPRMGHGALPTLTTGADFSADYHTFSLLWTPTEISFFIDGLKVRTVTQAAAQFRSESAQIIIGVSTAQYAPVGATAVLDVDYLRIYRPRATGPAAYAGPFYARETHFNKLRTVFNLGSGQANASSSHLQALRPNPDWHRLDGINKPDFVYADAYGSLHALLWSPGAPTGTDFAWRRQALGAQLLFPNRPDPNALPNPYATPDPLNLNAPRPTGVYAVSYGAGRAEVMYQNEFGQLACAYRNAAGTWVREAFVTSADTQFADSLFVAQAGRAVYYRSTRNQLVGFYRQGSRWVRELVHPAANGRVAGNVVYDDMRDAFYYRGTDGNIYTCTRASTGGTHAALVPALPAPAARCLIATPDFQQLFFIDRNSSVQRLYRNSATTWAVQVLDPSVRNAADNLVMRGTNVFYRSTDNYIFNYYPNGAGWGNACLSWAVPNVAGDLRLHSLEPKLYFRTTDNRVQMFYYTDRWYAKCLHGSTGSRFTEAPVLTATNDLYAIGTDGQLVEFGRAPTGNFDVNGSTPGPLPIGFD